MVYWNRVNKVFDIIREDPKTEYPDALLLFPSGVSGFKEYNFRWLTDIDQPVTCIAVFYPDHCKIISDKLEEPYLQQTVGKDKKVEIITNPLAGLKDIADKIVGVNYSSLSVQDKKLLDKKLNFTKKIVPADQSFYKARLVKATTELNRIKSASFIAEQAENEMLSEILSGNKHEWTETELAGSIASFLRSGVMYFGKEIYSEKSNILRVSSGCNTAMLHPEPTSKKINEKELISFDINPVYRGYNYLNIDTVFTGKKVNRGYDEVYGSVTNALNTAVDMMCDGEKGSRVYHKAKKILSESPHFHFIGAPTGLEIHEPHTPNKDWVYSGGRNYLRKNSVYNLFASILKPGKWGVRVSYTVKVGSRRGVIY